MDLGIAGRKAIVCASSLGLGRACAMALAREGVDVVINGRHGETLARTRHEVERVATGAVTAVVGDVSTRAGRDALLAACPEPDILVTNNGGPPPGDFLDFGADDWLTALNGNMLSAIDLVQRTVEGMMARGFGRIVNITSSAVKAPIPGLDLSNGARCGLTGALAGIARQAVRHNVTINNLLPGTFRTRRIEEYYQKLAAQDPARDADALLQADLDRQPSGRFGDPDEFGAACAFLCSARAGYLAAQNILLDGGEYPGNF